MKLEEEIKQVKFRNAHHKAVVNLLFTTNWFVNQNKDFFKKYGVTNVQFNILRILRGQHPQKLSGAEIKSRMLDKNSDVSRLLDRLIVKKLIEKSQCPNDKRASDVIITPKGLSLLAAIDTEMDKTDRQILGINAAEAKLLSDLLDKCRG
ncbi:MAG: MarR family transcriptional regulator [Bacteroidetes bacterium]|nr:MarR family transcriptional regulator [Bacteroidota bacterium]MBS1541685.1 MarR family transcriptional regulator [Bacteroidota bacterium]